MLSPTVIDAVIFDIGGVFLVPHEEPIGELLRSEGLEVELSVAAVREAHYRGIRAMTDLMAERSFVETDWDNWRHYDAAYFASAGVSGAVLDRVLDARAQMRLDPGTPHVWRHVIDHNVAAFARIARTRPVAIVSNNDGTAVEQCEEFGICQLEGGPLPTVAAIVDSAVVGVCKPDPQIFEPAIEALGVDRERTLYVGDTVHADVVGATEAGLGVVQLDPLDLHGDHAHWRLPDVVALADHLSA